MSKCVCVTVKVLTYSKQKESPTVLFERVLYDSPDFDYMSTCKVLSTLYRGVKHHVVVDYEIIDSMILNG